MYKFLLLLFLLASLSTFAQDDKSFVFSGYILSEDSIPFENVHLINYRTTKIVTTKSNGYFKMYVEKGDSIMTNHISLKPTIIHSREGAATTNKFYITFQAYQISPVTTNEYKRERENLANNMKFISKAVIKDIDAQPTRIDSGGSVNIYNRDRVSAGLDLLGIFKLFKKKR